MKTTIMTALLASLICAGFANETKLTTTTTSPKFENLLTVPTNRDWFGYVRMGLADSRAVDSVSPGLGLGWRYTIASGAIDVSAAYTGDVVFHHEKVKTYNYTLPRVSYLYYMSPVKTNSFYAGAGLGFGGIRTEETAFDGFVGNLSLGYETNRLGDNFRQFIQLDISQPAIAVISTNYSKDKAAVSGEVGVARQNLGPIVEFSFAIGY